MTVLVSDKARLTFLLWKLFGLLLGKECHTADYHTGINSHFKEYTPAIELGRKYTSCPMKLVKPS